MIQKKLAKDFYGLVSCSLFRSQYQNTEQIWLNRVFDNRFIFSIEGGYKPDMHWEFSMRWIYAGGSPYTPFDITASESLHRAVLDENRINQVRYPDYHSLNIRFDKRWHFNHSNFSFDLGPFKYIFNNPAMHIWHHAYEMPEGRKYGINFGISLSLWDYLFGTAVIPYSGRDINLGFPGIETFPKKFLSQVLHGFKKKSV